MNSRLYFLISLLLAAGCSPRNPYNRSYVADKVRQQQQYEINQEKKAGKFDVPPGVVLSDGVTEDEAVTVALWNNAQYQADLVGLQFAQADLTDAGIIQNPLVRYLSPNGGIVAQGYIYFYLDAIWQRPNRVAAAKRDAHRVAENTIQRTFTLIRDVQNAYADLVLARKKATILQQNAQIRFQISALAHSRLRNGDISELEATTARVDSVNAADNFLRAALDTTVMRARFNTLLGIRADTLIPLQSNKAASWQALDKKQIQELTYSFQPELAGATAAMEAAGKRIGWERSRIITLTGVLNGQNFAGTASAENALPRTFDMGVQTEIPIFNRNQGRIARAKAELQQAALNYVAIRQRIDLDLTESYARYEMAWRSYQLWNSNVLPPLEQAVRLSSNSYQTGDVSYLPVLEATRQMLDAQVRQAEVEAELRKAVSQLNFRIGKKVINP
ncbi:MAG TPA: TolC family protein [Cyclobacteriaceae bacterium]|nr:TolC family protein [Cyclobacteriaceae bacterium]